MPCAQCGFGNQPQAKFCGECGAALLSQARASTALPLALRSHAPLSYTPGHLAEKILTSKTALEGVRKQVTVLFADLKGSMELLADRDPEDARQLLDPVLERMMAAVQRYVGTVNQVMGDGIMALFGAPIAHEDHAVRACYAVLAMQAAVQQYAAEVQRTKGVPIQIRVGLNAGEVVVRSIGSDLHMDYTAVGQTTHLAARMEHMAMPGSILITAEVLRLVEGYVQVDPLGPVPIKGLPAPAEVYEVTGAGPVRSRLQAAAARGLTRFVGRDTELDLAQGDLEHAIRVLDQGLALCRASGNRSDVQQIGECLGYTYALQGDLAEGRALVEEAISESIRTGALRNHSLWVARLSEVCRLAGHWDEAWQHARQALDLARQHKERANEALALHQLGAVHAHADPPDVAQAEAHYRQSLALADELDMRPLQAHCHHGLGTLYATVGQRKQARAVLTTVIAMYRVMDMTFWLPQAEAALAQVEGR